MMIEEIQDVTVKDFEDAVPKPVDFTSVPIITRTAGEQLPMDLFAVETPAYTLNTEQQAAFDWLIDFCTGRMPEWKKVLLQGYAGTGKSFMLTKMIEEMKRRFPSINFGITAPTHKAVRVLKQQSQMKDQLEFGTIHSFLALKQKHNENTGEVTYEPDFRPNGMPRKVEGINILVVDESSMLDDKLFEYLEDEIRSNQKLRIIYVGDALQIPPVGKKGKVLNEVNAIPFIPARRVAHKIHLLELIEPQRQSADSPIIMYAHAIRNQINNQSIQFDFKDEYKHALERIPTGNLQLMKDLVSKYFLTPEFEANPDYCKFIAYTNKTTKYFNSLVREMKHGTKDLPYLLMEDKLIMEEPLIVKNSVAIAKNEDLKLTALSVENFRYKYKLISKGTFKGSDQIDPLSAVSKYDKFLEMKVYKVRVLTEEGKEYSGRIVHEDSLVEFKQAQEELRQAALSTSGYDRKEMWSEFFRFDKDFLWVAHNYAITAHKSQGSTYQFAISHEWDIDTYRKLIGYEEANRIRYVAATRPKQKLYIIK